MFKTKNIITFLILILTIGCSGNMKGDENNNIERISIIRFDQDFHSYLSNPRNDEMEKLIARYPYFLPAFGQITTGKMIENDTIQFFNTLSEYFSHPALMNIYKDELEQFTDLSVCEGILSQAQSIAKDILPSKHFPRFMLHVSGFKENVIAVNNIVSLSADKYLGETYPAYQSFFNSKERSQMTSETMPRDYLKAWIISENIIKKEEKQNLLSAMIEEGKNIYLLSKLLPEYSSFGFIGGFTPDEANWLTENEQQIWKNLTKENTLFSSDNRLIMRYTSDVATINNYPNNTGSFIGWRIVESYAKNTNSSVEDILSENAEKILKGAKYKP